MKKTIVVLIVMLLAIACIYVALLKPMMRSIAVELPRDEGSIHGLVFKGSQQHPLDGTLRLCWMGKDGIAKCFQQTSIQVDPNVDLKWNTDVLEIWKSEHKLMALKLDGNKLSCIQGNEYLEEDPYEK